MKALRSIRCVAVTSAVAMLGFAALFASSAARAQAPMDGMGPVAAQEKVIWDGLVAADYKSFASMLAPDFVYVGNVSVSGRDLAIAGAKSCKYNSYKFGPAQTHNISKDVVLLTYITTVDEDCGPADHAIHFSGDLNCSSTWAKRDGKWWAVAHTESEAMKAPAPPPPPAPPAQ